mgnify:CR=1 FL=1
MRPAPFQRSASVRSTGLFDWPKLPTRQQTMTALAEMSGEMTPRLGISSPLNRTQSSGRVTTPRRSARHQTRAAEMTPPKATSPFNRTSSNGQVTTPRRSARQVTGQRLTPVLPELHTSAIIEIGDDRIPQQLSREAIRFNARYYYILWS